jgi:hypothetical protein
LSKLSVPSIYFGTPDPVGGDRAYTAELIAWVELV